MKEVYRIEHSTEFSDLEKKVNTAIQEGYTMVGAFTMVRKEKEIVLAQVLIKPTQIVRFPTSRIKPA